MNKLFLFDIDGTLVNVKRGFMHHLLESVLSGFGLTDVDLSQHRFAGRTDLDIFHSIINSEFKNPDETLLGRIKQSYLKALDQQLRPEHVTLIDHVMETLSFFDQNRFSYGLLTGNFKESAYIKLNRAGLDGYFKFGAFGSYHTDRNRLPEIALREARKFYRKDFLPQQVVIIGDTPKDIACAQHFGAISVAVTTGYYTRSELQEYEPDFLLDHLSGSIDWTNTFD